MDQELLEKVMNQVKAELGSQAAPEAVATTQTKGDASGINKAVGRTEFVGTSVGDTIGLVIASVDPLLKESMKLGKFRSIGIIGGRTGAGPQIMAVDDAVKATNTEVISVELPRDTKGGAGHGSLIIIGAEDVSDARRAVETALQVLPNILVMSMAMKPAIWNSNIRPEQAIVWKKLLAPNLAKLLV